MSMIKVLLCTAISLFFATSFVFSQNYMEDKYLQGMVQVEKSPAGTIFVKHIYSDGQSLYGISQFYDVPLYDIKRYNPALEMGNEQVGLEILIPIDQNLIIKDLSKATAYRVLEKLFYQVKKGDTPFGIATRTFDMEVGALMALNQMTAANMLVGQYLQVGWIPAVGLNYFGKPVKTKAVFYSPENESFRREYMNQDLLSAKKVEERGAAVWNKDAGEDFDFYVMHKNAPKNTLIAITNPDTGRTIYTKVLGKIPPKYPNKVKILVSPKVAKQLGAVNAKFFVSLSYHK